MRCRSVHAQRTVLRRARTASDIDFPTFELKDVILGHEITGGVIETERRARFYQLCNDAMMMWRRSSAPTSLGATATAAAA